MNFNIIAGDNRDTLKTLEDNSVDAIVTDPPYGIDFLGKDWDANTGAIETYQECLRVLKPGGHILAFSAARTYHHLAITLEQAGFEIRDQIMWLYGSGFPKAHDIGKAIEKREGKRANAKAGDQKWQNADGGNKTNTTTCTMCGKTNVQIGIGFNCQNKDCEFLEKLKPADNKWAGWKTALKPAHEPIVMARKPFKGSCIDNVLTHSVGALNIDASRVGYADEADLEQTKGWSNKEKGKATHKYFDGKTDNTKTDYDQVDTFNNQGRFPSNVLGEVEGYQKFFYCPKVSRRERHTGFEQVKDDRPKIPGQHMADRLPGSLDHIPTDSSGMNDKIPGGNPGVNYQERKSNAGNNHPTVKPVALMRYLIQLVTPPNATVLDPFTGSGSTGMAAVELGHTFIGCELDPEYVRIAETRIKAWNTPDLVATGRNK